MPEAGKGKDESIRMVDSDRAVAVEGKSVHGCKGLDDLVTRCETSSARNLGQFKCTMTSMGRGIVRTKVVERS